MLLKGGTTRWDMISCLHTYFDFTNGSVHLYISLTSNIRKGTFFLNISQQFGSNLVHIQDEAKDHSLSERHLETLSKKVEN